MEEKDYIKDLFAEKLSNAEAPVNPELWSAISSKIGTASVVSTGLSTTAKWLIGLGTAASVAVATVLLVDNGGNAPKVEIKKVVENKIKTDAEKPDYEAPIERRTGGFLPPVIVNIPDELIGNESSSQTQSYESLALDSHLVNLAVSSKQDKIVANTVDSDVKETPTVINNTQENSPTVEANKSIAVSSFEIKQLTNTFTINNDGNNDLFFLEMKGIEDFVFTVLNSKNEIVFKSTDPNFKWDGLDLKGEQVPAGKYVYFFTGKDSQGNPISKSSNLTVIKN